MEQRISIITLGVKNIDLSRKFYEQGLGWAASKASNEHICFIQLNAIVLALYPRQALAEDACLKVKDEISSFGGITLAYNTQTREDVNQVLQIAKEAGATILKPAQDTFWGGYSGYFADLDGHPWEVAWNPHFLIDQNGNVQLP